MEKEKISFGGKTVYKDENPKEFERMTALKRQDEIEVKKFRKVLQELKDRGKDGRKTERGDWYTRELEGER